MSFHQKSYDKHSNIYAGDQYEKELAYHKNWYDNYTVNLWRHLRLLDVLNPFLQGDKNAKWLTVGDGRFGTSAMYIQRNGGEVIASDIDDTLLKIAKDNGLIDTYSQENAENISYDDEAFDYAYCKEAYHHFPRPYLAIYEMLRCTKKAIIFTEPQDWLPAPFTRRILQIAKNVARKLLGRKIPHKDEGNYETSGNYVYTISKREFEKAAIALNLPMVAFKTFHDVYLDGMGNEQMGTGGKLYKRVKRMIFINEIKRALGIGSRNRISAVIFKELPSEAVEKNLRESGYCIIRLPKNPFL